MLHFDSVTTALLYQDFILLPDSRIYDLSELQDGIVVTVGMIAALLERLPARLAD